VTGPLAGWSFDPLVVTGLVLFGGLYAAGWRRLARRGWAGLASWRAWTYAAGLLLLGVALLSPLDAYGARLFFVHMIQHLLMLLVIPPLIWLGAPLLPTLWGLPARERLGAARLMGPRGRLHWLFHRLTDPRVALGLYVVVVAVWHVPPLYDAAQGRTFAHDLEHASFFGAGLLYWWPIIHPTGGRRRLGLGAAVFYLLPPFLVGNLLGALLTFAGRPLYQTYVQAPRVLPLSALQDQQLGGLIMWVPGGLAWLVPLFAVLALFLRAEDRRPQPPPRRDSVPARRA
jgi:cytochrome c oxidase assembly factor CtaG